MRISKVFAGKTTSSQTLSQMLTMKLKENDKVKLLPSWTFEHLAAAPVWGGPHGYIYGVVEKAITHDHDPKNHIAQVKWTNGCTNGFPESALAVISNDEFDIAEDAACSVGPIDRDIWCLIKTSLGNWGISAIESMPFGWRSTAVKYVAAVSQCSLPSLDKPDFQLVGTLLGQPDYREFMATSLFDAANFIFTQWDLPDMGHLPLPLPEFASLKDAAASAPADMKAGALWFHLPRNLIDYSDYPCAAS